MLAVGRLRNPSPSSCHERGLACAHARDRQHCRRAQLTVVQPSSEAGGLVYVAGMAGIDVTTGDLAGATIREQTRQALANCRADGLREPT